MPPTIANDERGEHGRDVEQDPGRNAGKRDVPDPVTRE